MAEVRVLRRVRHNNTQYGEGEVIGGLTDKQAQQLVDAGEASFDTEGRETSTGKTLPKKSSQVKSSLLGNTADKRKSVSQKAQEREQAKADEANGTAGEGDIPQEPSTGEQTPDEPVELPESFTTPEGDYSVKRNVNGQVSGYLFSKADAGEGDKPTTLKKADFQAAYEASLDTTDTATTPADKE